MLDESMNLEKIAQLAGVSRATVSRVINNYPHVSETVRQRVKAVIDSVGFQPGSLPRALARQRTQVIGAISAEGVGSIHATPYFPLLMSGISASVSQSEYVMSLWVGSTPDDIERMYRKILSYKLMDGALILSAVRDDPLPKRLLERGDPLVMIGRPAHPEISFVDIDNFAAAKEATQHLIGLGYRRIGHLTGNLAINAGQERLRGYEAAMSESKLGFHKYLVIKGDFSEASGVAAAERVQELGLDAIFVSCDAQASGLIQGLRSLGIDVPGWVAVVAFDDLPLATQIKPALTTIRQPVRELGAQAISLLIDLIEGRITEPKQIILPTELVVRESCGAASRPR